jgi:hypothetical protein
MDTDTDLPILTRQEALQTRPLATDVVPIPAAGGAVRVRALTRDEALSLPDNEREKEAHVLALGIVEPALSVSEVKEWLRTSPAGELQAVSVRIAQLSGMLPDSAKETYKSDGDGSDA